MGESGDTTTTGAPARDPFAAPPEGAADRPWQPRGPVAHSAGPDFGGGAGAGAGTGGGAGARTDAGAGAGAGGGPGAGPAAGPGAAGGPPDARPGSGEGPGNGSGDGSGAGDGRPPSGADDDAPPARGRAQVPPPHPWNPGYPSQQGQQPPLPRFPYPPPGPRYDPNDPTLRRSRLALLSGIWGFFFMVLGVPYVTLLLGALALYWGVSSLRGEVKPSPAAKTAALTGVPPMPPQPVYPYQQSMQSTRPHVPAALGGVIAGAVSLALVGVVFGVQLYYKSYYDCQANALTKTAYDTCATSVSPHPPTWLTQFNGG